MPDTAGTVRLLLAFSAAVANHDRDHPDHVAVGLGMSLVDLERLGIPAGHEVLPGVAVSADAGAPGSFRVLCRPRAA